MRAIFLSYRRDDSEGEAGRLFDDLVEQFGEDSVFMDVAAIEAGRDFRKAIDESVATCGVLLAIIGKEWIDVKNEAGQRRLDDPSDFVRLETASALTRDIPVIPVLVRGAIMPRADQLPEDLKELAYRNGVELTHARWPSDLQLLIKALRTHVVEPTTASGARSQAAEGTEAVRTAFAAVASAVPEMRVETTPTSRKKPKGVILGAVAVVLVVAAAAAYLMMPKQVAVPELTGTPLSVATAKLQALKLAVGQTTSKEDATKDANTVLSQSPSGNTTVKSGDTVDLVISQKPQLSAMVEVPSLVGKSFDAAKQALEDRQLMVGTVSGEANSDKAKDTVLDEFPSAGQKTQVGAKVDLKVAAGKALPSAPGVKPAFVAQPSVASGDKVKLGSCRIVASQGTWVNQKTVEVLIDNVSVGVFRKGPTGGRDLNFPCTPGQHRFTLLVKETSRRCSGTVRLSDGARLTPDLHLNNDELICGLVNQ